MTDCAGDDPLLAARLVVSEDLVLESRDERHVVVVDTETAERTRLSLAAYAFLKTFAKPTSLGQIVQRQALPDLLPRMRMLVERRMLIDADAPKAAAPVRQRSAVAYKFCGAPAYAASGKPDFVILGLPYDLAGDTDSRDAPALIRRKSLDYAYQLDLGDGRPRGWFDVNRSVWMLHGARLADAGDIPVDYGESQARYFERAGDVIGECCGGVSIPVILGGDPSVTRAALRGLGGGALTVVRLAANLDSAAVEQCPRLENVTGVAHLGGDVLSLGERRVDEIVRAWGDALAIYLSIDLTAAAEGNATTLPLHALKAGIAAIGRMHHIVGIDLVGLDLRSSSLELAAITGCHLALAAMSAAHDRL